MTAQWTTEQVLALAPDPGSIKNGQALASPSKWQALGRTDGAIWGECRGSGKAPYRTQIDLREPAFRCSCPSRKFPCKHGLGLMLLLVNHPGTVTADNPPDWVEEWLAKRQAKQVESATKAQDKTVDVAAQAKRASARQRKVSAGVQDLRKWLEDRVRQGLAGVPQESYQFWDGIAARMVDAQAPGLARQLRELAGITSTGANWSDRLLERLGRLYLLLEGYERLELLPETVQADLRTQIGWTIPQEEVLAGPALADLWLVVGQRIEPEERLQVRRTWLQGLSSDRPALILDFAHGRQPFEQILVPGSCLEAELVFYPSAYPLRALVKSRQEAVMLAKQPPGYADVGGAIAAYSQALASCPWLERFPLLLQSVIPLRQGDQWILQDDQGVVLPLTPQLNPMQGWQLLALSGGSPLAVFGEWDGMSLLPLGGWQAEAFYGF